MRFSLLAIVLFCFINIYGQCNGHQALCNKKYSEVAYLTTHNAFNTSANGFSLPNQNNSITDQLNDGVRGFMLDVYSFFGTPTVYHGTFALGSAPLQDNLAEFKNFLDANPNEIVTIILECYISANEIESEIIAAGLSPFLFAYNGSWPTLQDMIDNNQRLVVFSDVDDAGVGQDWYHYMWDHMVETHYSVNDVNDFNCDYNRGDPQNDLYIFNHFVTNSITGIGQEAESQIANTNPFLTDRIEQCETEKSKFPNFITLDFYELGDGMQAVDILNGFNPLKVNEKNQLKILICPNPFDELITVSGHLNEFPSIFNLQGKEVTNKVAFYFAGNNTEINTSSLASGIYFLEIQEQVFKVVKQD